MQNGSIVIVTNDADLHADAIVRDVTPMGRAVARLHPGDAPATLLLHTEITHDRLDTKLTHTTTGKSISTSEITSDWYRRPRVTASPAHMPDVEKSFARNEYTAYFQRIWAALGRAYWISAPQAILNASHKLEQIQRAKAMGFNIPQTLVTNNVHTALNFLGECHGPTIYRVLTSPLLNEP